MNVHRHYSKAILTAGVAMAALTLPGTARAQQVAEEAGSSAEIVVTANKRQQRLIDVAAAVTALGGTELTRRNLRQVEDFATQVPGLSVQQAGNRATRIVLRGLNAGGAGATVATVIDEAALSYASSTANGAIDISNFDTYDLDRIEVLRGPQGTLYGAAAQGGIIKYVTKAPDLNKVEGGIEGGLEIVDKGGIGATGRGYANLPFLNGRAAIRLTGFHSELPGYIDNPRLGLNDANNGQRYGGRAQLLFQATNDLSVRLTAIRQEQRFNEGGRLEVIGAFRTPTAPPANQLDIANGGRLLLNSYLPSTSDNSTELYSGVINWTPDFADFVSATSYGKIKSSFTGDSTDAALAPGFTFGDFFAGSVFGRPINIGLRQTNNLAKFNQEFRISSKPENQMFGLRLDWQVGAFYSKEDIVFDQFFDFVERSNGNLINQPFVPGGSSLPANYEEISVFGTTKLTLSDQFNIEVGARNSWNRQDSTVTSTAGFLNGPVDTINPPRKSDESAFTWSVAPQFRINDDHQVYARIATGYRPGGPTLAIPGVPAGVLPDTYLSDSTVNYEVGYKAQLFDKKLTIDVAAFYIDWTDIQVISLINTPTGPFSITGNAGKAVSKGGEWSIAFTPVPGLTISDVGSYIDARLSGDAPGIGGLDKDRLPYVPKFSNTVNIDYNWTLKDGGNAFVGGSWAYVGDRFTDFTSSPQIVGHIALPSYNLFSAQAGVEIGRIRVELYGRNLSNNQTLQTYGSNGGPNGTGLAVILQPRTFGFRVGVKY